jgi:hypothetical protein
MWSKQLKASQCISDVLLAWLCLLLQSLAPKKMIMNNNDVNITTAFRWDISSNKLS